MTQAHYDDALEELVIMEMLPFHCVERGNYLKYFRSTSPDFMFVHEVAAFTELIIVYVDAELVISLGLPHALLEFGEPHLRVLVTGVQGGDLITNVGLSRLMTSQHLTR